MEIWAAICDLQNQIEHIQRILGPSGPQGPPRLAGPQEIAGPQWNPGPAGPPSTLNDVNCAGCVDSGDIKDHL